MFIMPHEVKVHKQFEREKRGMGEWEKGRRGEWENGDNKGTRAQRRVEIKGKRL